MLTHSQYYGHLWVWLQLPGTQRVQEFLVTQGDLWQMERLFYLNYFVNKMTDKVECVIAVFVVWPRSEKRFKLHFLEIYLNLSHCTQHCDMSQRVPVIMHRGMVLCIFFWKIHSSVFTLGPHPMECHICHAMYSHIIVVGVISQIGGKWALDLHFTLLLIPFSMLILLFPLGCFKYTFLWYGHLNTTSQSWKEKNGVWWLVEVWLKLKGSPLEVLHFKCPSWRHGLWALSTSSDWPHIIVIKCHHVKLKDISWHLMTSGR